MKLHEALRKSNKVRRKEWLLSEYFDFNIGYRKNSRGDSSIILSYDIIADDWEPIFEKKKMYQAVIKTNSNRYFISNSLYCDEKEARKDYPSLFVKLLTDRPIEVEVDNE